MTGDGVHTTCSAGWYNGPSLISYAEQVEIPDRTALRNRPMRATVNEYSQDSKGLVLRVRMESGRLTIGDKIRVCPTMNDAIISDILEPPVKVLTVPDIAELRVSGVQIDEVAPINMISSYDLALPKDRYNLKYFLLQLMVSRQYGIL